VFYCFPQGPCALLAMATAATLSDTTLRGAYGQVGTLEDILPLARLLCSSRSGPLLCAPRMAAPSENTTQITPAALLPSSLGRQQMQVTKPSSFPLVSDAPPQAATSDSSSSASTSRINIFTDLAVSRPSKAMV